MEDYWSWKRTEETLFLIWIWTLLFFNILFLNVLFNYINSVKKNEAESYYLEIVIVNNKHVLRLSFLLRNLCCNLNVIFLYLHQLYRHFYLYYYIAVSLFLGYILEVFYLVLSLVKFQYMKLLIKCFGKYKIIV